MVSARDEKVVEMLQAEINNAKKMAIAADAKADSALNAISGLSATLAAGLDAIKEHEKVCGQRWERVVMLLVAVLGVLLYETFFR